MKKPPVNHPVLGDMFSPPVAPMVYPASAGFKEHGGTSQLAGDSVDAATLRTKVVDALRRLGPMTADETADVLGIDRLSIRPRLSELLLLNEVEKTTLTRANVSGHSARVWKVV